MVALTRERIDRDALVATLKQPGDGAVVVFDGIVRDNTRGRKTLYLDYEAYEEMALAQMQKLAREAAESGSRSTAWAWCIGWGGWRSARAAS